VAGKIVGSKITRSRSEKLNMKNDYIALLDDVELDFSWRQEQIPRVIKMWEEGYSLEKISIEMKRRIEDVFILLYDLSLKEKIKARKGGLFGSREDE